MSTGTGAWLDWMVVAVPYASVLVGALGTTVAVDDKVSCWYVVVAGKKSTGASW